MALEADVADAGSIASAVERFGDVDVLVANAGLTHYMPFAELPLESAEQMSRVNWLGTLYTVKAALPRMLERRRGHVVIVSSGGGVRGFPEAAVYNGTKAAQRGFAEALRLELAGSGVSVTTVYPGEIETSLHDHEWDRMPAWYHRDRRSPPGPLADADGDCGRAGPARAVSPAARASASGGQRNLARPGGPHASPDPRAGRRSAPGLSSSSIRATSSRLL